MGEQDSRRRKRQATTFSIQEGWEWRYERSSAVWVMDGWGYYSPKPGAYLLHIPNWVLAWHLTLAALQDSHALVMRAGRGATWARFSIDSIPKLRLSNV